MGLVNVSNLLVAKDEHGPWMEADYSISETGIQTTNIIRETPLGKSTGNYVDELVFAFGRLNERRLDDLALSELNYAAPGVALGALITFEDASSNLALTRTRDFERAAPEVLRNRIREKLQLYLRYIEKENAA